MTPLLDQATAALQSGQKPQAQALIAQALKANPRDEEAWLLLEQCVDPPERKKYCLQQVLAINPQNPVARARLADLEPPTARPPAAPAAKPPELPATKPLEPPATKPPEQPPAAARPLPVEVPPPPTPNLETAAPPTPASDVPIDSDWRTKSPEIGQPASPGFFATAKASQDLEALDSAFETLPDEPLTPDASPEVSSLESALMDSNSYKPSAFAMPAEVPVIPSAAAEPFEAIPEEQVFADIASETEPPAASDEVPIPAAPNRATDKNSLRLRLEMAVDTLDKRRQIAEGIVLLEELLEDDPRNEMAWMWLGTVVDDDLRKRECFTQALEINPRNELAWMRLGAAVDDDLRKRECYTHALEINPRSKVAKDFLKAIEDKLDPDLPPVPPLPAKAARPAAPVAAAADAAPKPSRRISGWLVGVLVTLVVVSVIIIGVVLLVMSPR